MRNAVIPKMSKTGLIVLALMLMSAPAIAGQAELTWQHPTQYVGGGTIAATGPESLGKTTAEYRPCASAAEAWSASGVVTADVAYPTARLVTTTLTNGQGWCFRLKSVLVNGTSGVYTAVGFKAVPAVVPDAPVITSINLVAGTQAFKMRVGIDGYEMVAFGTVAPGTPCDATKNVDGYNVIPRAAVTKASRFDSMPTVVFSQCS